LFSWTSLFLRTQTLASLKSYGSDLLNNEWWLLGSAQGHIQRVKRLG
jgi:hypothetical protein